MKTTEFQVRGSAAAEAPEYHGPSGGVFFDDP